MLTILCRVIDAHSGHWYCCRILEWTAPVGQSWDTYNVAPWGLYNIIWRFGQWVMNLAQ